MVLTAAALVMLAGACEQSSSSLEFNTIEVNDFMKHPKGKGDAQGLEYKISFTYPSVYGDKAVLEKLQRGFISAVLGEKYTSLTPEKAVNALIEDWKKTYHSDVDDDIDDYPEWFSSHSYNLSNTIVFTSERLVQCSVEDYWYRGGTHGSGSSWASLFDLKTGQKYDRNDIFDPNDADEIHRLLLREIYAIAYDQCNCKDVYIEQDAAWTENTDFAVSTNGITFLYSDYMLGAYYLGIREVFVPYVIIFPHLRPNTPVWEVAKEKNIEVGATLESLLKLFPKFKMEVYYNETGAYTYTSLKTMLDEHGTHWYSAYNDYAIFTPLNDEGREMEIAFCISFQSLDNRDRFPKESTVWMVIYNPNEPNPGPPPSDIIVGTWRGPVKRGHVAYLEIFPDGTAGLYLGDNEYDQLFEIYSGSVYPYGTDYEVENEFYVGLDFSLNWYIYESDDGTPITGVPDTYKGTYFLRHEWEGYKQILHLKAIDNADPLFGRPELKLEWVPKTLDGGRMADIIGEG